MAGHAAHVGDVVVHEGDRLQRGDRVGLRAAFAGGVAGRDHALDREAQVAQVAQPRRLELKLERRHADQIEAGIAQAVAGLDRPHDRRHRGPEVFVERGAELQAVRRVEPFDVPAVHRPVGLRVALRRRLSERALPRRRVAEVKVEQNAVGVECDEGAGHAAL